MRKLRPKARQPSLKDVMELIINISARLTIDKEHVQHLMAEEMPEGEKKLPSPTLMCSTPGLSRDCAYKPTSVSSGQDLQLPQPTPRKAFRPRKMAEGEKRQKMSDGGKKPLSPALICATLARAGNALGNPPQPPFIRTLSNSNLDQGRPCG